MGPLHIGNSNVFSDGHLILSYGTGGGGRNFRIGYNFLDSYLTMGDFMTDSWKGQIKINPDAPDGAFTIESDGSIVLGYKTAILPTARLLKLNSAGNYDDGVEIIGNLTVTGEIVGLQDLINLYMKQYAMNQIYYIII